MEASIHNFPLLECGYRKKFGDRSKSLAIKLKVSLKILNEGKKTLQTMKK
jgi:hypothetical protein